jgi:hypothetical protein
MDGYLVQQTLKGRMFIGSTTYAGVVVPAYNATAQVFGLWNPAGSGRNLVLDKLNMALATIGTEAVAAYGLSYLTNTGGSIGTGAPISAFTATAPVNGLLTEGDTPKGRFTLSATITAPTFFYDLGVALISTDLNTATNDGFCQLTHDFNGAITIPPGVYVGLGSSAAGGQTMQASITWYETDR